MRRYKGIEIESWDNEDIQAGDFYLLRVEPQAGDDRYVLSRNPGRTNLSREVRYRGWLGTTNNVARYACGAVRVTRDAAGRVRIRPIDVAELVAAEECSA